MLVAGGLFICICIVIHLQKQGIELVTLHENSCISYIQNQYEIKHNLFVMLYYMYIHLL